MTVGSIIWLNNKTMLFNKENNITGTYCCIIWSSILIILGALGVIQAQGASIRTKWL
jgi:hypothetical protein